MIWVILGLCIFNTLLIGVLGFKLDSIYSTVTRINERAYEMQTDFNQLQENIEPFINSNGDEEFPDEVYKQSQRTRKGI